MKSLGLALTLFVLTGAFAALDLSGAHRLQNAKPALLLPTPTPTSRISGATSPVVADSDLTEAAADDDEADSEIINAFLVTPRTLASVNSSAATPLRYD